MSFMLTAPQLLPQAAPPAPASPIDELAGELAAALANLVAQGMTECKRSGHMSVDIRRDGGGLVADFIRLQEAYADELDLDRAREHAARMLRECSGEDVSDATIELLLAMTFDIVDRIIRLRHN
jgi:hypothetical protein